jgi:hypothetical protein
MWWFMILVVNVNLPPSIKNNWLTAGNSYDYIILTSEN